MAMMVIVVENSTPRLRGRLAVWLLEIRSGVYVGSYSVKIREMIWSQVVTELDNSTGDAILIHHHNNDSGYKIETTGSNRRIPVDLDGIQLVKYIPKQPSKYAK